MTDHLTRIQALYQTYLETAIALERSRKPGDGLLGFGAKPADDPCHSEFADSLETALRELAGDAPGSDLVREVLTFIYEVQLAHQTPPSVYWMLLAVHGLTIELIPLLSAGDAAALRDLYDKAVPKRDRLPVQKRLYKALKRQAVR